jgi:flagellar biosynthesis protein FlhA
VLLIPSPARYHLRRWLEPFLPGVTVLSPAEIPPVVRVRSVGTIG